MSKAAVREIWQRVADVWKPLEDLTPSEFAAKYRHLKDGTTAKPGLWSNEVFPYLTSIMDSVKEAIETGKRGVVLMKSGQGGGSEAMINAWAWLQSYYPGPMLYLISKDELAKEFGRERFGWINETCEPLARKHLGGRTHGELLQIKRYTDGKLVIQGGRSVLNLQTTPYRCVIIDEVDSLLDEIEGHGDPIKLAEVRTDAWAEFGPTLIIAFAHPSTKDRGAGRLYYELSDQRRGTAPCPHCATPFWLRWEHVKVIPKEGQTQEQADRDPDCYTYITPCCGATLTDTERFLGWRAAKQVSTLTEEQASKKRWIGVHFSQLYMQKPLAWLAHEWIEGLEDEAVRRVFINKRMGDVYETKVQGTTIEAWRELIVRPRKPLDPEVFSMGQVPPWVTWLTCGQDSNARALHYAVWGWGLVRTASKITQLCGCLIECGEIERAYSQTLEAAELHVFDQLVYDRVFETTDLKRKLIVVQGFHDSGWQPIAVYEYAITRRGRVFPIKGMNEDEASDAPFLRWSAPPKWRVEGQEVSDVHLRRADLNTFTLKSDFLGLVDKRFDGEDGIRRSRIVLPLDVPEEFLKQSSSEYQTINERKKLVWKHRGPNHWSDCNIYAYAAALNSAPFVQGRTQEEIEAPPRPRPAPPANRHQAPPSPRGRSGPGRGGWIRRR